MDNNNGASRRDALVGGLAIAAAAGAAHAQSGRGRGRGRGPARGPVGMQKYPNEIKGLLPIMETPFTESGAVDWTALEKEARFIAACGAKCMIWGQIDDTLTDDERLKGTDLIMRVSKELPTRICLGVNGRDTADLVRWAKVADAAQPDWIISRPPLNAKTGDEILEYYRALGRTTKLPVIIQSSGPGSIAPPTDVVIQLAREFPNFGYVKEESPSGRAEEIMARQQVYLAHKPPMKSVLSANFAKGLLFEMRMGIDGFVTGSGELADVLQNIWSLHEQGPSKALALREAYAQYALMRNLIDQMPKTMYYLWKKRGIFSSTTVRTGRPYETERVVTHYTFTQPEIDEIEYRFAALKPYLKA